MATLQEYLRNRANDDSAIKELSDRLDNVAADLARQRAVTEYNIMMGLIEDPEEE